MAEFPYLKDGDVVEVQRGPEPGGVGGVYRAFGETLRGLKTTMARLVEGPLTIQYPEEKTPVYPRFRGQPQAAQVRGHGAGEVRRLLALRRRLPGRLHPRRRRREHPRRTGLGRRALRRRLRDQPLALHLLRLLRDRLSLRRDHDGHDYEMSDYDRSDLIFTKEMLLAEPIERTPLRAEGE